MVTLTADYRRYLMPIRPLTVAMRVQHVGRYGADATDSRLLPLVWTVRDLVRGYSLRDAVGRSCATSDCQVLTEAGARRATVGNVELRIPFVGPLGVIRESGPLPIDAFLFADIGWFASGIGRHAALLHAAEQRRRRAGERRRLRVRVCRRASSAGLDDDRELPTGFLKRVELTGNAHCTTSFADWAG